MTTRVRRSNHELRFEMTPLLDVIFLLLTFFIYSLVLMVQAQILPVKLPSVAAGQDATQSQVVGITLDAAGKLYLNRKPIDWPELQERMTLLVDDPNAPNVYVALEDNPEAPAAADRGPALVRLIDMFRQIGLKNFFIVGREREE